jgi:hypothetical protein
MPSTHLTINASASSTTTVPIEDAWLGDTDGMMLGDTDGDILGLLLILGLILGLNECLGLGGLGLFISPLDKPRE